MSRRRFRRSSAVASGRRGRWLVLLAGLLSLVAAAGCSSATSGAPKSSPTPKISKPVLPSSSSARASSSRQTSASPSTSAQAASSSPTSITASTSGASTSSAPATQSSSSAVSASCPAGSAYCDTFDNTSSGWPQANDRTYHAYYTKGGFYSIGETGRSATTVTSPKDISFTHDFSVRIDVDVTPAHFSSKDLLGVDCWRQKIKGGAGAYSGFLLMVSPTKAEIVLADGIDGREHTIVSKALPHRLQTGQAVHMTFDCAQGTKDGGPAANLTIWLNRKPVAHAVYTKSEKNYDWQVANDVALRTDGPNEEVYFDNFALTSLCKYYISPDERSFC